MFVFNKYKIGDIVMDIVKLDVPLFIRLLELAREDIKQDADIHDLAQRVIELSKTNPATMADYNDIVTFMKAQGKNSAEEEIEDIKRLSGAY
jgi:DNA-binding ferritin-like protein